MDTERKSADGKDTRLFSEPQPASVAGRGRWKVAAAVAVAIAIVAVLAVAGGSGAPAAAEPGDPVQAQSGGSAAPPVAGQNGPGQPQVPVVAPAKAVVLATVNGANITSTDLAAALKKLPAEVQTIVARDQLEFLDGLVMRTLLLQEARRAPSAEGTGAPAPGDEDAVIGSFLKQEVFSGVQVTDDEVRAFYEEHNAELQGSPSFDDAKEPLTRYVTDLKRRMALESYANGLREKASVTFNEAWVAEQKARIADNPLDRALKTGRPVMASFGEESCPPCQLMAPILKKLAEEYAGRAEIAVVDVLEHPAIARRYAIEFTPTQVFFDAAGLATGRQEGLMSRDDMVARLKDLGVK